MLKTKDDILIIEMPSLDHLIRKREMDAKQLHDHIIKPTLEYMGGNYNSENARFLLLCTAAIESNCGYYIKQVGGPALGIWQMEPDTHGDINMNCDALADEDSPIRAKQDALYMPYNIEAGIGGMINNPMYACFMARLKYSMDKAALPDHNDIKAVYDYYKRIYNTPLGASTYDKFKSALANNHIMDVEL